MSLPAVVVPYAHIVVEPHVLNGSPVVRGSRIPVRRIWSWHRRGVAVETLVKRYPTLGWPKVLAALAFAYDNEELVQADLDRERALLDEQPYPTTKLPIIPGHIVPSANRPAKGPTE